MLEKSNLSSVPVSPNSSVSANYKSPCFQYFVPLRVKLYLKPKYLIFILHKGMMDRVDVPASDHCYRN